MKNVTIYSTSTCHYCHEAKKFLEKNNIPFTDYNVGENAEKRNEMLAMTGQMGVPVIVIDDKAMIGYDENELKKALEIA